jgi:hypothetical protein
MVVLHVMTWKCHYTKTDGFFFNQVLTDRANDDVLKDLSSLGVRLICYIIDQSLDSSNLIYFSCPRWLAANA